MSQWLVRPHIRPASSCRLFCFPYAGVGASAFRRWPASLGSDVDVVAIQPPGRESRHREPALPNVLEVVAAVVTELEPLLDRPYALFGHSLGGVIAFEVARELLRRGRSAPVRLFVSASRPPQLASSHPPVRDLPDLDLLKEIDRRYGATVPVQVMESSELRALFVPSLRADIGALETYVHAPGVPLPCPISAFAGAADLMVPPSAVEQWRAYTAGPFTLRIVNGAHLFIQSAHVDLVAAVREDLLGTPLPAGGAGAGHPISGYPR